MSRSATSDSVDDATFNDHWRQALSERGVHTDDLTLAVQSAVVNALPAPLYAAGARDTDVELLLDALAQALLEHGYGDASETPDPDGAVAALRAVRV